MQLLTPNICIVGAGSAGLSVAAGAAQLGAETVLIEAGEMGGDCLNYGCVPSKALLAAAKAAVQHRAAEEFRKRFLAHAYRPQAGAGAHRGSDRGDRTA